jgi:rhamnulokinase
LGESGAILSNGTWSLTGCESDRLFIDEKVYVSQFSNEGGIFGRNLLLRNTVGMWIQERKREWKLSGEKFDYDVLEAMAEQSESFFAFIDADAPLFSLQGDMPWKIRKFCRDSRQNVLDTIG